MKKACGERWETAVSESGEMNVRLLENLGVFKENLEFPVTICDNELKGSVKPPEFVGQIRCLYPMLTPIAFIRQICSICLLVSFPH